MANLKSAKKRMRRNEEARKANKKRMSRTRTAIKKVEQAIDAGDAKKADEAFKAMQPEIDRAEVKGLMPRNTVARRKAKFSRQIKALKSAK